MRVNENQFMTKKPNQLSEIQMENIRIKLMDSINKYWILSPQTDPLCAKMRLGKLADALKRRKQNNPFAPFIFYQNFNT